MNISAKIPHNEKPDNDAQNKRFACYGKLAGAACSHFPYFVQWACDSLFYLCHQYARISCISRSAAAQAKLNAVGSRESKK
jgi:hypothetical protein